MHRTAQQIVEEFEGQFSPGYAGFCQLWGAGPYTAAAIASFAFDEAVAVLDGNVYRVLARIFGLHSDIAAPSSRKDSRPADQHIPANAPADSRRPLWSLGPFSVRRASPTDRFARCKASAGRFSTGRWCYCQ